ncbi:hypothetical protein FQN55_001115 [Onygenales sp. PD_40]|nr:hypothetical protein FQN55_001115 [Onygenales sp. PD_40]
MAFKNGLSERLEELRFSSPRSPPADSPFSSYPSPTRGQTSYISAFPPPAPDVRANLQRRFTTDASKLSSWPAFSTSQPPPLPESVDFLSTATQLHKSQLLEKKKLQLEQMREHRRRFELDMMRLEAKEKEELEQLNRELAQTSLAGPVSEPTTPPEYRENNGFPTAFSRPTRFSTSSATAPTGFNLFNSQVLSPAVLSPPTQPTSIATPNQSGPHSMLGSRRNSEEEYLPEPFPTLQRGMSMNRFSMPTSTFASQAHSTTATATNGFPRSLGLNPFQSAKFAFGEDEEKREPKDEDRMPTPDVSTYLKMTDPDDNKFPTLIRRDDNTGLLSLSANSAALDLANSRTPGPPEAYNPRHHASHQSLPHNSLNMAHLDQMDKNSTAFSPGNESNTRQVHRNSLEPGFSTFAAAQGLYAATTNGYASNTAHSRPTSLQMSYSTNDIPTAKTNGYNAVTPPKSHAHSASVSRIPATPHTNHGIETPTSPLSPERDDRSFAVQPLQSVLQASAAPFGPQLMSPTAVSGANSYGYGVPAFLASPVQTNGHQPQNFQTPYSSYTPAGYAPFSPGRQNRRSGEGESQFSRFSNVPLENYQGDLYTLCKDQHGCRYLQRKLEEQNPAHVQLIFLETHHHVVELMTDPFGNYLCQKLLEYSNDEQRTALINNAAPQLVKIALNQHGTRALQKMIEFISTPEQTLTVINALKDCVVELVQDLNGNHVIQKCLNRLSATDAQFIYDAVGRSCVKVGTHRHGCCVLQRCIDHASGEQRARLIDQITNNAFTLVQDPFGNYVVQYILDLNEPHFIEPICRSFRGNIPALSKQKFSSNVIEKCIRTADLQSRAALIEEMLAPVELDKMLKDSFANYVVQTAMDFADPDSRVKLLDAIRPILPAIRQTAHGRRIAGKMMSLESQTSSGQITPNDMTNVYQQIHSFPTAASQYPQHSDGPGAAAVTTSNEENGTTIYSPIPQQVVNGFPPQGFPFYG